MTILQNDFIVFVYSFLIVLIGIAIDVIAFLIHLKTGIKMQSGPPVTFMFSMFWFMGLFFKYQVIGNASTKDVSEELSIRFIRLCERLKLSNQRLLISEKSKVSGSVFKDEIFVTRQALGELSPQAVDFIMGHELAHRRMFNAKPSPRSSYPKWLIWLVGIGGTLALTSLRLELPWMTYIPIFLPLVGIMIYVSIKNPNAASSSGPEMELACDLISMNIMDDPPAAVEALSGLSYGSKFDQKLGGYPSKEDRLEQAQRFLSGEPRSPYKNRFVEENTQRILADLEPSKLSEPI